jgi:hypothetical protein
VHIKMVHSFILSLKASLDFGGLLTTAQSKMDVYGLSQEVIISASIVDSERRMLLSLELNSFLRNQLCGIYRKAFLLNVGLDH